MSKSHQKVTYQLEGEILEEVKSKMEIMAVYRDRLQHMRSEMEHQETLREAEKSKMWNYIGQHYPDAAIRPAQINKDTWELVINPSDLDELEDIFSRLFKI